MNHPLGQYNTLVYGVEMRQGWYRPGRRVSTSGENYTNWSVWNATTGEILVDHRDELEIIDIETIRDVSYTHLTLPTKRIV